MRRPVLAPYTIRTKRGDVVCYKESGTRNDRKRQVFKLHRVIMDAPSGKVVDHINRNPTDNRKSNLRICTPSENGKNLSKKKNNTSGYVGICWDKFRDKWAATIKVNYKNIHLGRYEDINEAIKVRKAAEVKYFGDFAPREIA